jgi:hypothetical protein
MSKSKIEEIKKIEEKAERDKIKLGCINIVELAPSFHSRRAPFGREGS